MVVLAQPWKVRKGYRGSRSGTHAERRARRETAASVPDTFLDVVVLLSVLMFLVLALGVGVLALQAAGLVWHGPL